MIPFVSQLSKLCDAGLPRHVSQQKFVLTDYVKCSTNINPDSKSC